MIQVFLLLFNMLAPAQAKHGFVGGLKLTAHPISGVVKVACEGFNGAAANVFNCRDSVLGHLNADYFRGPAGGHGDSLELISHQDGKSEARIIPYNTRLGSSVDKINLWLQGAFSKPLLKLGTNEIKYRIFDKKTGQTHYSSKLNVEVDEGKAYTCPTATYESTNVNDCYSQYNICQKYFREHRYCKQ